MKLFLLTLFTLTSPLYSHAMEQSSEIPLKREFPLNAKEKPCNDFHKYVCSNVEASFKLREDRSLHDFAFSDSSERILEAKKAFFANIDKEKNLSKRESQVKSFYEACMNEKTGIEQEIQATKKLVDSLAAVQSMDDFFSLNISKLWAGEPSIFSPFTNSNKEDPNRYDVGVLTKLMNLPQYSYYDNKDLMAEYRKLVLSYFRIVEPKTTKSELEKRVDAMIDFEKKFVQIYPHPEEARKRWSEKREETQKDFSQKYSALQLQKILAKYPKSLMVSNPIPEALDFLVQNKSEKNLQAMKDFYLYSTGNAYFDDSQPAFFKQRFEFDKKYLGGPNTRPERTERCTKSVMRSFNRELDATLLPRLFPNFPEVKIRSVAAKIKESMVNGLKKNTWLSKASKEKAILKIKTAKLYLVKPQNAKEWDFLPIKTYSNANKIENEMIHAKASLEKEVENAKHPVNLAAWEMGPLTVNAYYEASANKFVLPIGILQYPFFMAEGDLIENLGAVGTVFGHELGHGIDDQGAKYDEKGRLANWMSETDLTEFQHRGKRLEEYFDRAGHNGSLTLGENIADLVGSTFSYQAAFPYGKGSIEDKQRYFVAYARLWCYKARPKAEELQVKTNPHSLGWARINEQVKHQPGFQEAFSCKAGDPMYLDPKDQVTIW